MKVIYGIEEVKANKDKHGKQCSCDKLTKLDRLYATLDDIDRMNEGLKGVYPDYGDTVFSVALLADSPKVAVIAEDWTGSPIQIIGFRMGEIRRTFESARYLADYVNRELAVGIDEIMAMEDEAE